MDGNQIFKYTSNYHCTMTPPTPTRQPSFRESFAPEAMPLEKSVDAEYKNRIKQVVKRGYFADNDEFMSLVYNPHHAKMYRVCVNITKNDADADEAMNEAFLLAYQRIGQFKGESAFGTWLYRIAINASLTLHNQGKRRLNRETAVGGIYDLEMIDSHQSADRDENLHSETPENILIKEEAYDLINQFIQGANGSSEIIELRLKGFQYHEIADILSMPIGTVKSRFSYAAREIEHLARQEKPYIFGGKQKRDHERDN